MEFISAETLRGNKILIASNISIINHLVIKTTSMNLEGKDSLVSSFLLKRHNSLLVMMDDCRRLLIPPFGIDSALLPLRLRISLKDIYWFRHCTTNTYSLPSGMTFFETINCLLKKKFQQKGSQEDQSKHSTEKLLRKIRDFKRKLVSFKYLSGPWSIAESMIDAESQKSQPPVVEGSLRPQPAK